MTSDAKIGLLLGLVFIFIIAFIINGLPSFKGESDNNELTTTMVSLQNKQLGIGSGVSDSEVLDRPRLLESPALIDQPFTETPTVEPTLVVPQTTTADVSPVTSAKQDVRYSTALPGGTATTNNNSDLLITMPAEPTKTIEIVAPVQNVVPAKQEVVVKTASPADERSLIDVSSDVVSKVEKPVIGTSSKTTEYVVQKGDSLGSIANKVYGAELGKKKANIDNIFAANAKSLKSPDAIYVGQKLIIPSIDVANNATEVVIKEEKPLGSSMLERVKQIGQRGFSSSQEKSKPVLVSTKEEVKPVVSPKTEVKPLSKESNLTAVSSKEVTKPVVSGTKYVVKEGDNLWKIAHKELGDGNRFTEIIKMNQGVLKSQDSIVVGMTIMLPKK
ncbi:MAG TPA: LysM peptidoglycan-binding domain-containing protein [Sedimentisphaerales bacterium]|nr:LysM peptidoglycan-binding domain-containing protein [Sedimentisphaerales bacterium]